MSPELGHKQQGEYKEKEIRDERVLGLADFSSQITIESAEDVKSRTTLECIEGNVIEEVVDTISQDSSDMDEVVAVRGRKTCWDERGRWKERKGMEKEQEICESEASPGVGRVLAEIEIDRACQWLESGGLRCGVVIGKDSRGYTVHVASELDVQGEMVLVRLYYTQEGDTTHRRAIAMEPVQERVPRRLVGHSNREVLSFLDEEQSSVEEKEEEEQKEDELREDQA